MAIYVCIRRGLFFVFCLGFARTSLTTRKGHVFFLFGEAVAFKRLKKLILTKKYQSYGYY